MQYQTIPLPGGGKAPLPLCVIILFLISIFGAAAEGAVLYVDIGNSSGTENGAGWATAYTSVQDAVDSAVSGDEIWVAAGTYTGTGDYVVEMAEGVALYGGFAGTETQRSQRDWTLNPTTIDGENTRSCVSGTDAVILDGFRVINGSGNFGAGMQNRKETYSPPWQVTVSNCTFADNSVGGLGGAINCYYANIDITNCRFENNSAQYGGALSMGMSDSTIKNCTFTGNQAWRFGGAINNSSDIIVDDCYFINNKAQLAENYGGGKGGAIFSELNSVLFIDSVFIGNLADGNGGGIYISSIDNYESQFLINCSFSGNRSIENGGALYVNSSYPSIINCILWNNSADDSGDEIYETGGADITAQNSCIQGGFPGTDMISSDPLFQGEEDLQLLADSPCIDSGVLAGKPYTTTDIAGHPRPIGSGYDMGAYEMPEVINADVLGDQDRIVFPAGFTSFDPILSNTWVGATAMNINSSSKPITFFGKDPQGNTISTNDSLDPLVGRGQLANLTTELVPYNSQISTLIGEGNGAQLPL